MDYGMEKPKNDYQNPGYASDLSIGDTFGKAWQVVNRYGFKLAGIGVIYWLVNLPANIFFGVMENEATLGNLSEGASVMLGFLAIGYSLFVIYPIAFGFNCVFLKAAREETPKAGDLFGIFRHNYWNVIGYVVLTMIAAGILFVSAIFAAVVVEALAPGVAEPVLWLFLPVIILAFVYFSLRLAFVPLVLADEMHGPVGTFRAMRISWETTQGHLWTMVGMGLLMYLMLMVIGGAFVVLTMILAEQVALGVIGLIALLIGYIIWILWAGAVFTVFYHSIALQDGVPGPQKRKNSAQLTYA